MSTFMGYGVIGINGWLLLFANGYSSVNARTLLLSCLGHWMSYMTSSVIDVHTLPLYWIAFNSSVERWTILTLINNECGGVIDFNGLLPVDLLVMLLPILRVNHYSCHLWETRLMYVVVVHHMDDVGFMDDAVFLFFCYMMDEGDFSPLPLPPYSCHCIYGRSWNMKGNITLTSIPIAFIMMDVFGLVMTCISLWLFGCVGVISWVSCAFFLYSSCIDDDSLYRVLTILF